MTPRKHCPQEEREESRRILSLPGKSKQEPPQRFLLLQLRSEQGKKRLGWIASAPRWMRWGLDEWPPCPASTYSWAGKGNAGGLRRPARPATCRPWGDFSSTSPASVQSRRQRRGRLETRETREGPRTGWRRRAAHSCCAFLF